MSFNFLTHVILRTPRLSFSDYSPASIGNMLADKDFLTAIFLSSKAFYNALKAKDFKLELLNSREKLTLQNYYNRISFRTTPFGAFSSFTYTYWDDNSCNCDIPLIKDKLHLCPDQQYLQLFSDQAGVSFASDVKFVINPTIYKIGQNCWFVETKTSSTGTAYEYSLQTFRSTALLNKVITLFSNKQICFSALQAYLVTKTGCTDEEAEDFITFLYNSQIILNDKIPQVLGANMLPRWPIVEEAFNEVKYQDITVLKDLVALEYKLKCLLPEDYRPKVINCCYVNLQRFTVEGLDISYQKKITEVIEVAKMLMAPANTEVLETFAEKFEKRFEKKVVPLLQALDPVTGVGYGEPVSTNAYSLLLERIDFKPDTPVSPRVTWTAVHSFFLKKLTASPGKTIYITDSDIELLRPGKKVNYPASFSVMFNVVNDAIIIDGLGGISANALIGRFTPFNTELLESAKNVAKLESENNPGVVFAEINHLSDSHIDNINRRCQIYEYEIPINAMPVERAKQLALNDLYIRIIDGEVILESASLKKRVIPRLSSAYNYRKNDLNLFRFLSDLQYQNICYDFGIDLEKLFPDQEFYPRVEYKGAVLSLARWLLKKEDITAISGSPLPDENLKALKGYCEKHDIPEIISLGFSDKQLYFNLNNEDQAKLFIENIKTDEKAIIKEFIYPETTLVSHNGKPLINQFIAFLIKPGVTYKDYRSITDKKLTKPARDFSIGSEWLYLKIYCSQLVANELITEKIIPLMNKLIGKLAFKWFFVRYYENGHHIRLRIHIIENNTGDILKQLYKILASSLKFQIVREYQADTYRREMERYGVYIETIEGVFYKSSVAIGAYLKMHNHNQDSCSYYAYAFLSVMRLLDIFLPNLKDRIAYTSMVASNFIAEFKGDKRLIISLDKKYREIEQELVVIATGEQLFDRPMLKQKQRQFEQAFILFLKQVKHEPLSRQKQLVADIVHMHLNRAFTEQQRNHELVVYYCINKKLQSEFARAAKQLKKSG